MDETTTSQQQRTILIVGGSDGSGTRGVVQALGQLHVPMLVDDHQSLDVHVQSAGGWPPLVALALQQQQTESSSSVNTTTTTTTALTAAWRRVERTWSRRIRHMEHMLKSTSTPVATRVDYGFKAPVSMLLLPFFARYYKNNHHGDVIKFLHVVRDGRDIAVSHNQSPVHKFYDAYYGRAAAAARRTAVHNQTAVLAMDLWNDWNVQVAEEWCNNTSSSANNKNNNNNNGVNIDCLVVRAEDLIGHNKYTSLQRMAEFVGSPLSTDQLCCLAHRPTQDLGASAHVTEAGTAAVGASRPQRLHWPHPGRRRLVDVGQRRPLAARRGRHHQHAVRRNRLQQQQRTTPDDVDSTLEIALVRRRPSHQQRQSALRHHGPRPGAAAVPLGARFGKWNNTTTLPPDVLRLLEEHGQRGLALFGYHQPQLPLYPPPASENESHQQHHCDASVLSRCSGSSSSSTTTTTSQQQQQQPK